MEYGKLVEFYKEKLLDRYKEAERKSDLLYIQGLLLVANKDTLCKVLELLEKEEGVKQ
jgi:hypothetical protein